MEEGFEGFAVPVLVEGLELGVEGLEGLVEDFLEGGYLVEPVEGLGVGLGFEEGGGFGFALGEEGGNGAEELVDLLEEIGGGGEDVVDFVRLAAALEGEEVLKAAFGVAQNFVRGVEFGEAGLGGFLFGGVSEFIGMRGGGAGEEFCFQCLHLQPRLARFIEQRKGVSHFLYFPVATAKCQNQWRKQ